MPLPQNPQRIALVQLVNGQYLITREWLKILQEVTSPTGSGATDISALLAAIGSLTARVSVLEAKVAELEMAYHM